MEITETKEHEDGSATYHFDMTDEEKIALLRYGIVAALTNAIKESNEKYAPREE